MTPDRQAHNCRVTQRAMKRFGVVPGNDSRTVFGTLLGPLLCCSAIHRGGRSERPQQSEQAGATTRRRTSNGSRVRVALLYALAGAEYRSRRTPRFKASFASSAGGRQARLNFCSGPKVYFARLWNGCFRVHSDPSRGDLRRPALRPLEASKAGDRYVRNTSTSVASYAQIAVVSRRQGRGVKSIADIRRPSPRVRVAPAGIR